MAKKTADAPAAAPRRRSTTTTTTRRSTAADPAAAPIDVATVGPTEEPSADEIAYAAYMRYLNRGGTDGQDFDDWVKAEQELKKRNGR